MVAEGFLVLTAKNKTIINVSKKLPAWYKKIILSFLKILKNLKIEKYRVKCNKR